MLGLVQTIIGGIVLLVLGFVFVVVGGIAYCVAYPFCMVLDWNAKRKRTKEAKAQRIIDEIDADLRK